MIRVAINGYGNLGRGAEQAITKNKDMELVVVFTRRDPASVTTQGPPSPTWMTWPPGPTRSMSA